MQSVKALGIKVVSFDELRDMGKAKPAEAVPPSPDDFSTIMYGASSSQQQYSCRQPQLCVECAVC